MEQGFKLVRTRLEAILGRPALVRETSHKGFGNVRERLREWVERARRGDAVLSEVVFEPALERRLQQLATATKNTRLHQAPFRHVMFYGPPGWGSGSG